MHPTNSPVFEFLLDFQAQYNTSLLINEDSLLKLLNSFQDYKKEITLSRKQPGRSNIMISLKIKRQVFQRLSPLLTKTLICLIYREIFFISEGDNELYILLNQEISRKTFLTQLKKKQKLKITESLSDQFTPVTFNTEGKMINNEFLLFFKNNKFEQKYEIKRAHVEHSAVSRSLS